MVLFRGCAGMLYKLLAVVVIATATLLQLGDAHFALTYPRARYPDYDFLDNIRTGGPCGVPNCKFGEPPYSVP